MKHIILSSEMTIPNTGSVYANGKKFKSKEGCEFVILAKSKKKDYYYIQFTDTHGTVRHVCNHHIKDGTIKNPYHRSVYDVGFTGEGYYGRSDSPELKKAYKIWSGMLERCYSNKPELKSYSDVIVCDEWHNFQNFAQWFLDNYIDGFHLDKDLLSDRGNKFYSPDNCIFIPREINSFIRNNWSSNTSGHSGASYIEKRKRWVATFYPFLSKRSKQIGYFRCISDAVAARTNARCDEVEKAKMFMLKLNLYTEKVISNIR